MKLMAPTHLRQSVTLWLAIALAFASTASWCADEPSATPYRPTLSNPAELSAPGWLEIEAGGLRSRNGGDTRRALPTTAKLAFDENWGMLLGGDLQVSDDTSGSRLEGAGDTTLTLKHRIAGGNPAVNFGIEAGVKLATAKTGLGSGKTDWTVNGIASVDFAHDWRLDANLGFTRIGLQVPDEGRTQALAAVSLSKALGAWGLAAELSASQQRGVPDAHQWLAAASYAVSPRLVLDAGFARARQGDTQQHSLFIGFTWLTGKMF